MLADVRAREIIKNSLEVFVMNVRIGVMLTDMVIDVFIGGAIAFAVDILMCIENIGVTVLVITEHFFVPIRAGISIDVLIGVRIDLAVEMSIDALFDWLPNILSSIGVGLLPGVDVNVLRAVVTALEFTLAVSLEE